MLMPSRFGLGSSWGVKSVLRIYGKEIQFHASLLIGQALGNRFSPALLIFGVDFLASCVNEIFALRL